MQPTVSIDTSDFDRMINRLHVAQRKTIPNLTRQSARRVASNLAFQTQPFGFAESGAESVRRNIRSDTSRVFRSFATIAHQELNEEQRKQFAFISANRTPAQIRKFLASVGLQYEVRKTAPRNIKKGQRNARGRVPTGTRASIATTPEAIEKLNNEASKRVGLAKHGWAICARRLGGTRGIPSWITRSKGAKFRQAGTVQQLQIQNRTIFRLTNNVPYIGRLLSFAGIRSALERERRTLADLVARAIGTAGR